MCSKWLSFFSLVIALLSVLNLSAQISHGGSPHFKESASRMKFETVLMPVVENRSQIKSEYENKINSRLKHAKFAHEFIVNK